MNINFRYREIERRELDRHSYEVQIKELTQQLEDETSFKTENGKLRDFIKKQTVRNNYNIGLTRRASNIKKRLRY